jgi:hypothetical protein
MGEGARAAKVQRVRQDTAVDPHPDAAAGTSGSAQAEEAGAGDDMQVDDAGGDAGDDDAAAAAAAGGGVDDGEDDGVEGDGEDDGADGDGDGGDAAMGGESSGDDELEAEVIRTVKQGKDDPLAAYDIDVEEDGEAIQLYLSMLGSNAAAAVAAESALCARV